MVFKEVACGVVGNGLNAVPGLDRVKVLERSHHWNISLSPDDKCTQTWKDNFNPLRKITQVGVNTELQKGIFMSQIRY